MRRLSILILSLELSLMLTAQHYIGFGANIQFPRHIDNISSTSAKMGIGGGAEMMYAFRYRYFLLNAGLGFDAGKTRLTLDDETLQADMVDTRGLRFTYNGYLNRRTDAATSINVVIPLRVGFEAENFYMLAGVDYAVRVGGSTLQKAKLMTEGDYNGRYYSVLTDMPNHGYHDYEDESTSGNVSFKADLRLVAELGLTMELKAANRRLKPILRIGAFVGYGVLNVLDNSADKPLTELDLKQYMHVRMNHVYSTAAAAGKRVNNFTFGLKVTYLIPVGGRKVPAHPSYWISPSERRKCLCYMPAGNNYTPLACY